MYDGRFLQHIFLSSQEKRENETCDKSETSKQVCGKTTFQNGHSDKGSRVSKTRRLCNFSRFERRISTRARACKSQKISSVLCKRSVLPVHGNVLWAESSSEGFHQDNISRSSPFTNAEHETSNVFGRLVDIKWAETGVANRSREIAQSNYPARFHYKLGEVCSSSNDNIYIHRGSLQNKTRDSVTHTRKSHQVTESSTCSDWGSEQCISLSATLGHDGILFGDNSTCQVTYETNTVTSFGTLVSNVQRLAETNYGYQSSCRSSAVVVTPSQYFKGQISSTMVNVNNIDNRLVKDGLWRSCGQSVTVPRSLVKERSLSTHKLAGNESSHSVHGTFPATVEKQMCTDQIGQYLSHSVHKQSWGDKISETLLSSMGPMELSDPKQYSAESSLPGRSNQSISRRFVQNQDTSIGMVTECSHNTKAFSEVGFSDDRSLCISSQPQSSDILHMDSQSSSTGNGCAVDLMGENDSVCVSTNLPGPKSTAPYVAIPVSNHSNSTSVASETLVLKSASVPNCTTSQASNITRSVKSTKHKHLSSQSRSIQSDGLAALNRNFKAKGFSKRTRKLLSASWRSGTQRDYASKFKKYDSWCCERQKDPYSASVIDCAEFLTSLFHEGLQYRTINGYRSMLSSVLPPIDNIPVGQHPYIIRLLKGVFNSRPPTVRLTPEWNLLKVLDMLQKPPFEPMKKCSLKHVTYKTIFLTAITTFRRCSDIQSLRVSEGNVSVRSGGIWFLRQGLSKQDRPHHSGNRIFVPAFPSNKKLDPMRAIGIYLSKTETLRESNTDKTKLFISIVKPHRPVSRQTIAKWIVNTIKLAYESDIQVKAHSTRAIGPSWALFRGASMCSILQAADWSRETTFVKFYLRNVDNNSVLETN